MNAVVAAPMPTLFRSNSSGTHAARPALGFRTGISPALAYPETMENQALAVAADGSIWTLTMNSVGQFSHSLGRLNKVCDNKLYRPTPFGFPRHLAPVNFQQAFFIQSKNNAAVVMQYRQDFPKDDGFVKTLAALPDNDVPSAISAGSDGCMCVLGNSGHAWLYKGAEGWQKLAAPAGTRLLQVSVGAADFILALTRQDGQDQLLRLQNGTWVKHNTLQHQGVTWIGACEGKEYWWATADMQKGGELHLMREDAIVKSFNIPKGAVGFAAATVRSCYFFSFELGGFVRAAMGIMDQPDQAWPSMTHEQEQIYEAMSKELGVVDTKGVRSQYTNINAPFPNWFSTLMVLVRPVEFTVADWELVRDQLRKELTYVQSINTLSINVGLLNQSVGLIYTNTYNQVVKLMGLPEEPSKQPSGVINVILDQLANKLEGALIDKAKTYIGSEAVGIAMACYKFANDEMAKKHKLADGTVPLIIACSELAGILNNINLESEKARGTYQRAILTDWGKLSGCGEAITSGVWYWSPDTNYTEIKNLGPSIALNFYQSLMPVKWKIILCQGVQTYQPPLNPYMRNVPRYSLMFKTVSDDKQNKIYWWWACTEIGAGVEQQTDGPFPNQKLMEAIFALRTTPLDFFTGQNGWKLSVATVPGYRAPPEGVAWQAYENAGFPF
ncbi:hypothetical protein [Undibacterium sp. Ji49W]|uniref:hypothetical protein n=1 Tax=Undibacterium sp. Ji49W TaxID=3413040 RepID=UPI003BF0BC4F